jgi:hypothetical protein
MHDLQPEFDEMQSDGVIDEATAAGAIALDSGRVFSVFGELRFAMYGSVAALAAGLGILLKAHLDRIAPMTIVVTLGLIAALCYGIAIRAQSRDGERSIGGDYVLLLGALILSADLGYAEIQFHWLGSDWSRHLLALSLLHAVTAYALRSPLVFSLALGSFIGWLGVEPGFGSLLQPNIALPGAGTRALTAAGTLLIWRAIHRFFDGATSLQNVLDQFIANLGFWGALSWCFSADWRLAGLAALATFAAVSIREGLKSSREVFVIYGVTYGAIGLCAVTAAVLREPFLVMLSTLVTLIVAAKLLWHFHEVIKADAE